MSSLLLNSLSQYIFQHIYPKWPKRKYGIPLSYVGRTPLTNPRFVDDVMLIYGSMTLIKRMISDVRSVALTTGLEIHPDKTKLLHNLRDRKPTTAPEFPVVDGMQIEVLFFSGTQKYLGRQSTFCDQAEVEIESRIKAAWKKFGLFKQELTAKAYSAHDRLRLFNDVVGATMLYGCAPWTLTAEMDCKI
ncbi:unnamed protein product [Prorocentrum cordatum]|uniref:Reverse transcriptase domain-containing protein n=1 Tax=Prorocentrum cordatum TaxID=2364126 RepID=A0ABN9UAR2_9DINO|nr:unnamed protein product [Polarella glacialis]